MSYEISKADVWAGTIEDRPGGLAEKLETLSTAGANLEFVVARRSPDQPGKGVVFLSPVSGEAHVAAAKQQGLAMAVNMYSLRLRGPDRPGLGATITRALAAAGINVRGLSAAGLGGHCVFYFAFDSEADADQALEVLTKTLSTR